ncbi:MAG: transposase [Deltaproteobacteria bacterium]|nr:transposase [Deltaproteobacteria bacterium]
MLSASTISRMRDIWQDDLEQWQKRDLSHKRYAYIWADGIYCNVRMEERQCLLVIIGATEGGKKELIALHSGYRESELSWSEILIDLKHRGLKVAPKLAIGDGSLGFWKARAKVYENTRWQRCWVHKTANVLNKLPKSIQTKAKKNSIKFGRLPIKQKPRGILMNL